ncbi:MAG: helix-turn-helix domain-containing protein [Magnetococcales bacterium]|nr:helix-turn-helix domain-containing protein [Magnetococcales bacterium]
MKSNRSGPMAVPKKKPLRGKEPSLGEPDGQGEEQQPPTEAPNQAPPANSGGAALAVGQTLREAREAKGLTLRELSRTTRIRDFHLNALENGELDKLPGNTFVVGFLKIYAKALDLPEKELVAQFSASLDGRTRKPMRPEPPPAPTGDTKTGPRPGKWLVLGGIVLLVVIFVLFEKYQTELVPDGPTPKPEPPQAMMEEPLVSDTPPVVVSETDSGLSIDADLIPQSEEDREARRVETPATEAAATPALKLAVDAPLVRASGSISTPSGEGGEADTEQLAEPGAPETVENPETPATHPRLRVATQVAQESPTAAQAPATEAPAQPVSDRLADRIVEVAQDAPQVTRRDQPIEERYPESGEGDVPPGITPNTVYLEAQESVWVQIFDQAGEEKKDMVLRSGQRFVMPEEGRYLATIGHGGGIAIFVGEERILLKGDPAEPINNLELTATSLRKKAAGNP